MIRIERFRRLAAASITTAALAAGVAAMPATAGQDTDPYAEAVLATNPDLYWQFNDAPGATTVADSSGHGAVGTVAGTVVFGVDGIGATGTAARMENLKGTITAARNASDGKDMTLAFWYRTGNGYNGLVRLGTVRHPSAEMYLYRANDVGGDLHFMGLDAMDYVRNSSWQFVTYTEKDGIGTLYQNARSAPVSEGPGWLGVPGSGPVQSSPAAPWVFGSDWDNGWTYTPTWIDEVATYSRALSATEISTLYAAGSVGNEPRTYGDAGYSSANKSVGPLRAGGQATAHNWSKSVDFETVTGRFRIAQRPSGNGDYLSVSARVSAQGAYRAKAIVRPDGAVTLQLLRVVGANEQILGATELPAGTYNLPDTALDAKLTLAPDARGLRLTGTWTVHGTSKELTVVDKATPLPSGSSNSIVYRSSAAVGTGSYTVGPLWDGDPSAE